MNHRILSEPDPKELSSDTWVIILAGGVGSRMRSAIRQALGEDRPKQYCTFVGGRSMLQHTMDRALVLVRSDHVVTVIGPGQRPYLDQAVPAGVPGMVFEQPADRGTAAGIFLAASYIMAKNPCASIIILPSDTFIHPEQTFLKYLREAEAQLEYNPERLILMGADANRAEIDYGWIEAADDAPASADCPVGHGFVPVKRFYEKPVRSVARMLLKHHGLWNTMVMLVKANTLWKIGLQLAPELLYRFEMIRCIYRAIEHEPQFSEHLDIALRHIYGKMFNCDFSADILMKAVTQSCVLPMKGVQWSDWGRPERVMESLRQLGVEPEIPLQDDEPCGATAHDRLVQDALCHTSVKEIA